MHGIGNQFPLDNDQNAQVCAMLAKGSLLRKNGYGHRSV